MNITNRCPFCRTVVGIYRRTSRKWEGKAVAGTLRYHANDGNVCRGSWSSPRLRPTMYSCSRADEPWTPAEDRRLLRLVVKLAPRGARRWWDIAARLGRTGPAVQSRYYGLQAGLRLAKLTT